MSKTQGNSLYYYGSCMVIWTVSIEAAKNTIFPGKEVERTRKKQRTRKGGNMHRMKCKHQS